MKFMETAPDKKGAGRRPGINRENLRRHDLTLESRRAAWNLWLSGMTVREISAKMKKSRSVVGRWLIDYRRMLRPESHVIRLEMLVDARRCLMDAMTGLRPRIAAGDLVAAQSALRIGERLLSLAGIRSEFDVEAVERGAEWDLNEIVARMIREGGGCV